MSIKEKEKSYIQHQLMQRTLLTRFDIDSIRTGIVGTILQITMGWSEVIVQWVIEHLP